jgi:hypothetical protein
LNIKDRVVDLRRVRGCDLIPNPQNWRTHPKEQQDALRGLLADVGFAGAVLARETPEGLQIIDGHLRAETLGNKKIPVLVLDVTEDEARKMLATFDPLGAMAGRDEEMLKGLLAEVATDNAALQALLDSLAEDKAVAPCDPDASSLDIPETYQVLITCGNEAEQAVLLDRFQIEGLQCRALIS